MNVSAVVLVGAVVLAPAVFGGTQTLAVAATPVTELRVEWETIARGDRAVVRGYVYNVHQMRVENVRLRIEQLDATARPIATRTTWVPGTLSNGDRRYFETSVAVAGATYRVFVESFDSSGCGDG